MTDGRAPATPLSTPGVALATGCYLAWGLTPAYWKGIVEIPASEALVPRILWTFGLLVGAALVTRRLRETFRASPADWAWSTLAAFLLATNWTLFIFAVQSDQVIATSLGYYINPLVSILFGLLLLGERLSRAQSIAVAIAAAGVAALTLRQGELPWISLVLATTFALYGLIHKLRPAPALGGLAREMATLILPCLAGVVFLATRERAALIDASAGMHAYLALAGLVTAVPLLLFHAATRRLPLFAVGMFQYIAPTLTLLLATTVYGEPFLTSHALGFGLVWIGLLVFSLDSLRRAAAAR